MFLAFTFVNNAQVATIGSGNLVNTTTTSSPINIWYRSSNVQMVYTVSELNAAGVFNAGDIHKLGFKIYQAPIYNLPGYTIKLKHTTSNNSNSNFGNTGWTIVKNGFTYSPTEGDFDMINFDTPFTWDGSHNIVVQVCWAQVQPTYNASGQCYVIDNVTNGYRYRWTDGNGGACGQSPNNIINFKPQIRFVFDTITVWNGSVNTDWFNASNWSAGVPNEKMDVLIPAGVPNYPNLTDTTACEEFILNGTMNMSGTGILNVYSHFTNNGTYNDNGGQLVFTGHSNANFNNNVPTTVYDLVIEKSNQVTVTEVFEIRVAHELKQIKGSLFTNNVVVIQSDAVQTARIDEVHGNCNYTLNMFDAYGDGWNGAILSVFIDGQFLDNYNATGSSSTASIPVSGGQQIDLVYSSGSWENENSYDLIDGNGNTIFSDGPNPNTGLVYTGNASCSLNPPYPIQGDITMERYIDAGETYWRFFSSAVQGATIGDYNDDFATAGYPGSLYPNFGWVSVYTYDETLPVGQGYLPASSAAQTIQTAQGLYVWCGDTITGTQPFVVDLKGPANQGDIAFPVTYTSTGTASEDGWNLVGNPYPSTIDWESPNWTKTNIANAIYIMDPDNQQYATYVNGASTNGGSRYIPSQQAFWVYANGVNPQLIGTEKVKSPVDQPFKNQTISEGMTIKIEGNAMSDECVMRHVDNALDEFEPEFDAFKMYGGWGTFPNICLINTLNEELTVHSFDKQYQEWEVPLKVIVFQNGFFDLTFNNIQELNVPCLQLEDTYTGQMYAINEGQPISVELSDTTTLPRFIIHVGRNYEVSESGVSCSGHSDGSVAIDLDLNSSISYNLTSSSETLSGVSSGNPLIISGLSSGTYMIEVPGLVNQCGLNAFMIDIPSPNELYAAATIQNVSQGTDGVIDLSILGGTPPYSVNWNTGQVSEDIEGLNEGVYQVEIRDDNNCKWTGDFMVNISLDVEENIVDEEGVYYNANQQQLVFENLNLDQNTKAEIYDTNGKIIDSFKLNKGQNFFTYQLKNNLAKGVYFVKYNQKAFKFLY